MIELILIVIPLAMVCGITYVLVFCRVHPDARKVEQYRAKVKRGRG